MREDDLKKLKDFFMKQNDFLSKVLNWDPGYGPGGRGLNSTFEA